MPIAVDVFRGISIPLSGDVTLAADLIRPRISEPVPALVTMVPYRTDAGGGIEYADTMHWFAERGYASLLVDLQGIGGSTGRARPPFDPAEAEDADAMIEWVADQPWCTGSVGMWGVSYGAIMSMRTASLNPPQLKAIVPIVGTDDLEGNFIHPGGVRGGLAPGYWGTSTLLGQLLPPMRTDPGAAELASWRRRLQDTEPYLVDLWRHGPGDPVWAERAVDASAITVPALCVAGWRDLFCDGSIRAYERMRGPKRLVAGPWMHTKPHESPYAAIEFREVMLRWWDYWLRNLDSGAMDEPAVTLYVQGAEQPWRGFSSWPPGKHDCVYTGSHGGTLVDRTDVPSLTEPEIALAYHQTDPTVGSQSGLWFTASAGFGLPVDQRDDDMRDLVWTSEPLDEDIVIAGRPAVTLTTGAGSTAERIVARITDVDPDGRSILVTTGLARLTSPGERHTVELTPTTYRVPAGHHVRIVLGDADFPHVWPATRFDGANPVLEITGVTATLPAVMPDDGDIVGFAAVDPAETTLGIYVQPRWQLTRDLIDDGVTVAIGWDMASHTPGDNHVYEYRLRDRATVRRAAPSGAVMEFDHSATGRLSNGTTVNARVRTHITQTLARAHGEVRMDGVIVFEKVWEG